MNELKTLPSKSLNKKTKQAHVNQKGFSLTYLFVNALYHNLFINAFFLQVSWCVYSKTST